LIHLEAHDVTGSRSLPFGCLFLLLTLLSCSAPPSAEDRKALVGKWAPEDASGHLVLFREDGVFDFLYDTTVPTVFELSWELTSKGKIAIKASDGSVVRNCYYTIEADRLSIDDGSHGECISPWVTPAIPMPQSFKRAKG
jgi:hypothetical protein